MDRAPGTRAKQSQGRRGVDDAAVYGATGSQELTSILNAPEASSASTWLAWPFTAASSVPEVPPPLPPGTLPEVHMEDFARYLRKIGDRYDSFEQDRAASEDRVRRKVSLTSEELRSSQGQGLVAALREVPAVFFQESFELDRPEVWGLLGDVESDEGRQEAMDKLGHYLDVVETHLVREIAARTDNFFDASGHIQDLRGTVLALYQQVAALRAQISQLEKESGGAVLASQRLQQQRANVLATLDTLKAMEEVAQAQAALQGLLPQAAGGGGVAADFVGAIDVLEVLQGVLDNQELLALDCFRTLPQQIAETAQAVDDLMATDFLERARFGGEGATTSRILQRLAAQLAATQTPRGGPAEGIAAGRSRLSSEGSVGGTEAEVVAAAKLTDPASLDRVAAWVEAVGEEGPPGGMDGGAAGSEEALQEVLLPLVMGMRRMGRLSAVLKDLRDVGAAGMVDFMRRVAEECLAVLAPGGSDSVHLVAGRDGSPGPRPSTASLLQQLPGDQFQWVLEAALLAARASIDHFTRVKATVQSVLLAAKAPHQQVSAAAAECQEACHAVAEVAVVRWAKLLSGRAHGGAATAPRLAELRQVLELTDTLASLAEAQGAKPALGLRSALQQLCKASLDAMHTRALGKLTSLLEAEQWSLVEVPPPFQQVVDRLVARAKPAAAQAPAKQPSTDNGVMLQRQPTSETAEVNEGGEGAGAASSPRHPLGAPAPVAAGDAADAAAPSPAPLQPHQPRQVQQDRAIVRKFTITPHTEPAAAAGAVAAGGPAGASPGAPQDVLFVEGQRYHVVNTALLLLSMVGDYLAFRDAVPAFSAEVAQRVLELLKIFNSRTCQLVLGAGAMQVSGLKSITAKHLAISCQCLGVYVALHPCLAAVFTQGVPQPRADLLSSDFARTAQDYEIHRDEICSKLVFIMRERLAMNLKQLPAVAASWPSGQLPPQQQQQQQVPGLVGGGGLGMPPPSGFAATNVKQLQILSGVLSPLLLHEEAASIFSRVALMFSSTLVEAFGLLESRGPAWEQQLQADVRALLECLERLPMDDAQREFSLERLRLFYTQRFERKQQQQQQQQQEQQQQEKRAGPPAAEASGSTSQPPAPPAEAIGESQPPAPPAEASGESQPPAPPAEASGESQPLAPPAEASSRPKVPVMPSAPLPDLSPPQAVELQAEGQQQQQQQQGSPALALAGHPLAEPQANGDPPAEESAASLQSPSLDSQGSASAPDTEGEPEAAQPQQNLGGQHSSSSGAGRSSTPDLPLDGPSSTAGPDSNSTHPASSQQAPGEQSSLPAGPKGSELRQEEGLGSELGASDEQQQQQRGGELGLERHSEDRLAGVEVSGSAVGHPLEF